MIAPKELWAAPIDKSPNGITFFVVVGKSRSLKYPNLTTLLSSDEIPETKYYNDISRAICHVYDISDCETTEDIILKHPEILL